MAQGSFTFEGRRIAYSEYGSGDRLLVLTHGLLMNRTMYARLAPEMARRGNRVVTIDLLGHGESDQPHEVTNYSMTLFATQVVALLDHLGAEQAVVGGTSLGANVALEVAELAPDRTRGLFIEMPVLENALLAAGVLFMPLAGALFINRRGMRLLAKIMRRVPRSFYLADIGLDWLRRDPEPSLGVLMGLFFGRVAPPASVRRTFRQPALIIGHPSDPLHPFSDADMLARELRNSELVDANSFLEWRINPGRLNDELAAFLDGAWAEVGANGHRNGRAAHSAAAGSIEGIET